MRIIASGMVPSAGCARWGGGLEALTHALEAVRDKTERELGYEISSALVNLSGSQISSLNSKGMAGVTGRTIGREDISRALDAARSIVIPYNREVVHAIPRGYIVDEQGWHSECGLACMDTGSKWKLMLSLLQALHCRILSSALNELECTWTDGCCHRWLQLRWC